MLLFELVTTKRQQRRFEETWEYFCAKYNWYNDPYAKNGVRYNLLIQSNRLFVHKKVIGTIEFTPYDPNNPQSTVERWYSFSKLEEIKLYQHRVWEIDKLCLSEEYQRRGLFNLFMRVFYEHAIKYQPKYYVAIMEQKFFRMLRIAFGLAVNQVGKEMVGLDTVLVPVIFDIEEMMKDEKSVSRLLVLT